MTALILDRDNRVPLLALAGVIAAVLITLAYAHPIPSAVVLALTTVGVLATHLALHIANSRNPRDVAYYLRLAAVVASYKAYHSSRRGVRRAGQLAQAIGRPAWGLACLLAIWLSLVVTMAGIVIGLMAAVTVMAWNPITTGSIFGVVCVCGIARVAYDDLAARRMARAARKEKEAEDSYTPRDEGMAEFASPIDVTYCRVCIDTYQPCDVLSLTACEVITAGELANLYAQASEPRVQVECMDTELSRMDDDGAGMAISSIPAAKKTRQRKARKPAEEVVAQAANRPSLYEQASEEEATERVENAEEQARQLLREQPGLGLREIGRRCGFGKDKVAKIRRQMSQS